LKQWGELQGYYSDLLKRAKPEWQFMFEFLVIYVDREEIVKSAIVWNRSVLSRQWMRRISGSVHQSELEEIINGFTTMLVGTQELQKAFEEYVPTFH
jgi:hypothetical protein